MDHRPPLVKLLGNPKQVKGFQDNFTNRMVIESKFVNFQFFTEENLLFFVGLENIEFSKFLRCQNLYSPKVIRAFYSNLSIEDRCIVSRIKGEKIFVSEQRLFEILGLLPLEGSMICP